MPATKPLPQDAWTAIADAGDEVRRTEQVLKQQRELLDSLIMVSVAAGSQVEAIAQAAGVSRETVYKAAERASARAAGLRSPQLP